MKFALIGDIHGFWTEKDTNYFNQSDYDALFFTGDFGSFQLTGSLTPKFNLERLTKKAFLIPGNWDGTNLFGIMGEVFNQSLLKTMGSFGYRRRIQAFSQKIRPVAIMGYSTAILSEEKDLALIVARPHAMGSEFSFSRILTQNFMVSNMEESVLKLKKLIDSVKQENIIFLAHNGPTGLGSDRTSIYGADFKKQGGDFGDEDLAIAIKYAKDSGKKIPAVLSGHMHHFIPDLKTEREIMIYTGGTFYVNGAKVPRIKRGKHFHTKIEWNGNSVTVIPIWQEY